MPIDFAKWEKAVQDPLWYKTLVPEFKILATLHDSDKALYEETKEAVYAFFEEHLIRGDLVLGEVGKDWDAERKPVDTIVIHHTSIEPGLTPSRLSAIELVRLYAPYYFKPYLEADKEIENQPIWSNHIRDSKQVFWPYHWFIREDGRQERLLNDEEIGWHAGKWEVNCRSIAICFDGDFETGRPSDNMLVSAARLIKERYPQVAQHIMGHSEINTKTTCPSVLFLSTQGRRGWKEDLLDLLK